MQRSWCLLVAVFGLAGCAAEEDVNPGFDFSAIEPFWTVQSILAQDRVPSPDQWDALFHTPGYRALTESEFTHDFFRRHLELAYMPSRAEEREEALAGPAGSYIRHYMHVAEEREQLDRQLALLRTTPIIPAIVERTRRFLPPGSVSGYPDVAFVIFANDGRAYDPIVIDLQASRNWDIGSFLAHEFHHWYRNRALAIDLDAVEEQDAALVWTLNQIQAEGVADQIDKRGWVLQESEPPAGMTGYARRYLEHVEGAAILVPTLDSLLVHYAGPGSDRDAIGTEIHGLVPQSGHPTGFFMVSLIMEQLGEDVLIEEVGNPFAFVRTFDHAAEHARRPDLRLSPVTVDLMHALEAKYGVN